MLIVVFCMQALFICQGVVFVVTVCYNRFILIFKREKNLFRYLIVKNASCSCSFYPHNKNTFIQSTSDKKAEHIKCETV